MATFIYFDNNVSELLQPNSTLFRTLEKDVQTLLKSRAEIEKLAKQYPYWIATLSQTVQIPI
jgi:hypothetical protein